MGRKGLVSVLCVLLMSVAAVAQQPSGYLSVHIFKVKPEKRAEFDSIVKKMVDANRGKNGDMWLASETTFGEGDTLYFTSARKDFAGIEQGMELFRGALLKAYGQSELQQMSEKFNSCIVSHRAEIRTRRLDLSSNVPSENAAYDKWIGQSRWLRTYLVRVRPGRAAAYEAQLMAIKEAAEKKDPKWSTTISQAVAGQQGTVFYITALKSSLAGFDSPNSMRQLLGEEGYKKYLSTVAETVLGSETFIHRFLPQLSNPTEGIASAAPEFWRPAMPRPTTAP